MNTTDSKNREKLQRRLENDFTGFEFVQAMRLLMRLYPLKAVVGGWEDPSGEVVRLTVPPTFAFPPAEIATLELPTDPAQPVSTGVTGSLKAGRQQARMAVNFLG